MGNPFVHLDLSCDDPEAAKKFYKNLFDWKLQDFPEMGGWTGIDVGGGTGGGLGKKQDPGSPTAWTAYVEVDDVKKTVVKAQKAGATVLVPFMEVGGMGFLAVLKDPQGATFGLWQTNRAAAQPPAKAAVQSTTANLRAPKATAIPARAPPNQKVRNRKGHVWALPRTYQRSCARRPDPPKHLDVDELRLKITKAGEPVILCATQRRSMKD